MGKVIKRARTRGMYGKQEYGKDLRAPPQKKKFNGKIYERWGGRSSKQAAEKDAMKARKYGDKVRIVKGKTKSGKTVYWLYSRDARKK